MSLHELDEARRCLQCKKPLCRKGCPINTDIPAMIRLFGEGRLDEAGEMLFRNNPLSAVCALVCDHEKQCEGHCILAKKGNAVHISSIENFVSSRFLSRFTPPVIKKNGKMAAIIGSGPAGITIAVDLAQRGYAVTLFEGRDKIGGVLRYGIPAFRLPRSVLESYHRLLGLLGVRIRPNTNIGGALRMDDLFRDGYGAVFIGTGVWRPNTLRIPGESLGNAHFAIDYLSNPDVYDLGETVSVIGAGNAAMDAARTILRHGARNVTVYARRPALTASPREVEYARLDGVRFEFCVKPVEIRPEGTVFRRLSYEGEAGGMEIEGSDFLQPSDSVVVSIGQGPRDRIVNTSQGIKVNERGLLITDENGATTREGIFASGDVVRGAKTVVEAAHYSKMVAKSMDQYMRTLPRRRG